MELRQVTLERKENPNERESKTYEQVVKPRTVQSDPRLTTLRVRRIGSINQLTLGEVTYCARFANRQRLKVLESASEELRTGYEID
jgi:hypothetical protein